MTHFVFTHVLSLSGNMTKNKDFILTFNLYENWDKTTLIAHLTFASCAKSFGDVMLVYKICRIRYTDLRFRQ